MNNALKVVLQVVAYGMFAVVVGYFSASPAYDYAASDKTTVKLSLSHAANRVKPCVQLTPKEIAELAPNMRQQQSCERERLPLTVELEVDGEIVRHIVAPPSGLWNDGAASIYERFEISPGEHTITVRLRETAREEGWDYAHTETVQLEAGRYFTITFRARSGGFEYR